MPEMSPDESMNFEAMLEEQNAAFQEASVFNRWMPPDGSYTVVLMDVRRGAAKNADGSQYLFWCPKLSIAAPNDAELDSRCFEPFISSKAFGILKGTVSILAGGELPAKLTLKEADTIFMDSIGSVLEVKVSTSPDKNGIDRTNADFVRVLSLAPVDPAEPVAETATPPVETTPAE